MADDILLPGCPCDRLEFPPCPQIPAGLASLSRQLAGFPEFRAALLAHIPAHRLLDRDIVPPDQQRPLQDWRAREGDDLGVMLLEMWAYVLDVLAFYEERIANESYLQTAQREPSLRRLVELIGYHPRQATASSVTLALLAETGKGRIAIPAGTAFRSGAFDGGKPQVFETTAPAAIDPALNLWTLAPIREPAFAGVVAAANQAKVSVDDFVLLSWRQNTDPGRSHSLLKSSASSKSLPAASLSSHPAFVAPGFRPDDRSPKAARVTGVNAFTGLDGASYSSIALTPDFAVPRGTRLADITLYKTTLATGVRTISRGHGRTVVVLDAPQPGIQVNDDVLLVRAGEAVAFRVLGVDHLHSVAFGAVPVSPDAVQPFVIATRLVFSTEPPTGWDDSGQLRLHFQLVRAGTLTRPAKDRLMLSDLAAGAAFEGTVEPPLSAPGDAVQLRGADGSGAMLAGTVTITAAGRGTLHPQSGATGWDPGLRVPVEVYGNLVAATRGETVANEVLGSGDPTRAFPSFKLKKNPLTWFDDPSGFNGRRSTLQVRVNGLLWTEAPSFYGRLPHEQVYIIRQNDDDETMVTFGDGNTGARLPRGSANVTATYRFGAGAAKPPPNSITQIARAVPGLRQVVNPVAPGGGSDADRADDLRRNAPTSSLLLGRAVSLRDFETLAREFGGVINASAAWMWDGRTQRAVVKIWFIADGGAIADSLRNYLLAQSDPNVPLVAAEAQAVEKRLVVDLVVDAAYNSDDVEKAVIAALLNRETGLLARENIPIGGPLFRSRILQQIHAVAGVVSARALRLDGQEAPAGLLFAEGHYLDFYQQLVVGNTASGDPLFA